MMRRLFALSLLALTACGSSIAPIDSPQSDASPSPSPTSPGDSGSPPASDAGPPPDAQGGPTVTIHVRATQAPVSQVPGTSGQTPVTQRMAFKSLTLYTSEADPTGYQVFDLGAAGVEVGLDDKNDTVLTRLPVRSLKAGKYTFARAGVTSVKFKVKATMHNLGFILPGEFDNMQALSDGAVLGGQARKKGWYRYTFSATGIPPQSVEGDNAPLPQSSGRGGIRLEDGPGGMVYAFPIDLVIDPGVTVDLKAIWEVNTHENFRWTDLRVVNYAAGVFDSTPTVSEPVVSFGANSGRLFWEQ